VIDDEREEIEGGLRGRKSAVCLRQSIFTHRDNIKVRERARVSSLWGSYDDDGVIK
jgi:hypothetical protein